MKENITFQAVSKAGLTDHVFNALSTNAEERKSVRHHVQ